MNLCSMVKCMDMFTECTSLSERIAALAHYTCKVEDIENFQLSILYYVHSILVYVGLLFVVNKVNTCVLWFGIFCLCTYYYVVPQIAFVHCIDRKYLM